VLISAGCTTTITGRETKVSPERALETHINLGMQYLGEGSRDMARFHLLKALDFDSRSAAAHNGMALLFQMELENELADKHFRKAISSDRSFTTARNNYGVFLFKQGRLEDAFDQFEAAGEDTAYKMRPQVFYSLGVTAEQLGRFSEAEDAWGKALTLAPRYPKPYLELAEHFYLQKDFEKARNYLIAFDKLSRPEPRSLWLAVRLADHFGNKDRLASKGLALEKLFPNSRENLEYQKWLKNDAR
jgi:type IV pilus assembly protein PilF